MNASKLRVGVVGGGLIAQAAHLPALRVLHDSFEVVGLADPSATIRAEIADAYSIPEVRPEWRGLLEFDLDAVVILTPAFNHAPIVIGALEAGLHVFVEKPLCITLEDADRVIAARDRAGKVVQVGYMKRFDSAVRRLYEEFDELGDDLQSVDIVTYDPGQSKEPFFGPGGLSFPRDVPDALVAEGKKELDRQIASAFPDSDAAAAVLRPFSTIFLDAIIHDLNLLLGACDRLGLRRPVPRYAATGIGGIGGTAVLDLESGAACHLGFFYLDGVERFGERAEFFFPSRIDRLHFDSPYLQQQGTRHERISAGETTVFGNSQGIHAGSYVRQLQHFHACVTEESQTLAPPEMARRDIALMTEIYRVGLETGISS